MNESHDLILAHYPTLKYCDEKIYKKKLAMLGGVGDQQLAIGQDNGFIIHVYKLSTDSYSTQMPSKTSLEFSYLIKLHVCADISYFLKADFSMSSKYIDTIYVHEIDQNTLF